MFKNFFYIIYNILDNLIHQAKIIKFLKFQNIQIVIDIGAHKGEFLDHIKKLPKIKKTYSCEPQKNIFKKLRTKTDNKSFFGYNIAISNKTGYQKMLISEFTMTSTFSKINNNSSYYKIKKFIIGEKKKYELVKTITLKDFIEKIKIKKIDLLKIDTEGHELNVLLSGLNVLKKTKLLLIEFRKNDMYLNYSSLKMHNLLLKNNFKLVKKFKFPLFGMEDRIYKNRKLLK